MIFTWNSPGSGGGAPTEELLVAFDHGRPVRVLVCPALFDEANKLRRFTIAVMRGLDVAGIDSFLPDLPGCNESLALLKDQTLAGWRADMAAAADALGATHVLTIRAGTLVAPEHLAGWHYAPQSGPKLLRGMIRARTIAAREAGIYETSEQLAAAGRDAGIVLGGWHIGARLFRELETAEPLSTDARSEIPQTMLGASGLWLRAEPDHDAVQAKRLVAIIAEGLGNAAQ